MRADTSSEATKEHYKQLSIEYYKLLDNLKD